jgi:hypothetical protein
VIDAGGDAASVVSAAQHALDRRLGGRT